MLRTRIAVALAITLSATTPALADLYHFDQGTAPGSLVHPHVDADQCSLCHSGVFDDQGQPYGPSDLWFGSMHASAVRDPIFRASMSVAEQDAPGIGSYCLRCHAPVAYANGHVTAPGGSDGHLLDEFSDLEGVQCTTCHRSIDASATDPGAPYLGDGRLFWDDGTPTKPPAMHGPFGDAAETPAHKAVFDPFTPSPQLCAQCHESDNPAMHEFDAEGHDTGRTFMLDTTFSEWSHSAYAVDGPDAQSCVDCHMPDQTGDALAANFPGAMPRDGVGRHEFVGGNVFGPLLMRTAFPDFRDEAFDRTRALAQAGLQRAATIEILQAPDSARAGDTIDVTVRVTNLTGHKLPSGFADGRRMWIALSVAGVTVSGEFRGDEILPDPQLRTYERVLGHAGQTGVEMHLARQNTVLLDTRIPPLGFVATDATEPRGRNYSGGAEGSMRNDDVVTYHVRVPASSRGETAVRARLLFQSTTSAYVHTLANDDHADSRGSELLSLWNTAGRAPPFEMASAARTIVIGDAEHLAGGAGCAAKPATHGRTEIVVVLAIALAILPMRRMRTKREACGVGRERSRCRS